MRRVTGVLLCLTLLFPVSQGASAPPPERPKLVVVLVVDQMRNDYVDDYGGHWTKGLRRLITDGARFRNAAYPLFNTVTCAGRRPGQSPPERYPRSTRIILNQWWHRDEQKELTCTDRTRSADDPVPQRPTERRPQRQAAARTELRADARSRPGRPGARRDDVDETAKRDHAGRRKGRRGDVVRGQELRDVGGLQPGTCAVRAAVHGVVAGRARSWEDVGAAAAAHGIQSTQTMRKKPQKGWTRVFPHALGTSGKPSDEFYGQWTASPFWDGTSSRWRRLRSTDWRSGRARRPISSA